MSITLLYDIIHTSCKCWPALVIICFLEAPAKVHSAISSSCHQYHCVWCAPSLECFPVAKFLQHSWMKNQVDSLHFPSVHFKTHLFVDEFWSSVVWHNHNKKRKASPYVSEICGKKSCGNMGYILMMTCKLDILKWITQGYGAAKYIYNK